MPAECVRCHREAPPSTSAEFLQWDPVSDDSDALICPSCLTPDEEVAAGEDSRLADVDANQRDGYL
jgi:Zn finger protein HypA/HybF involved in hydrogenase expression